MISNFRKDLDALIAKNGNHPLFIDAKTGRNWSWAETDRVLDRVAAQLKAWGVAAGDIIVPILPNSVDGLMLFLACLRMGVDVAPLPPNSSKREIGDWLGLTKAKFAVISSTQSDDARQAVAAAGATALEVDLAEPLQWLSGDEAAAVPPGRTSRLMLKTSGTTGEPKAMVFDIDRLWSSGVAFTRLHTALRAAPRFLNILPISYLGGLFNLCLVPLAAGGSVVVAEPFSGRSFLNFWHQVERFEVNVLWLVPTMVRGLLAMAQRTGASGRDQRARGVDFAFLGTAPIDRATKETFEKTFNIPMLENFALSETTFFTSETMVSRNQREEGSVGEPLPYVEVRLGAHPDADSNIGEIEVKSPYLILGYLGADGTIDLPRTDDGFFRTGDLGHFTDSGSLVIDGRLRDIIKKGGYFVSLREIEVVAEQNPAVEEAIAVSVPHDFYGEDSVLFVRLKAGLSDEALPELRSWLHATLVTYKWPNRILTAQDFPRTASGKVKKDVLKDTLKATGGKATS